MTRERLRSWVPLVVHSVILAQLLLVLSAGAVYLWHQSAWSRPAQWQEGWRHAHTPWIALERWIHFRFIHFDAQYWIVPVSLDDGPLRLEGHPPDAGYWSLTWYGDTAVQAGVSSETVVLEPDGSYIIDISAEPIGQNWISAPLGSGRAILYLRAYEPLRTWPIALPTVHQNGQRLVVGGLR